MAVTTTTTRATSDIDPEVLDAFIGNVRGGVIQPGDDEYDAARGIWNGMIDKRPALIARCADAADVIAAVNFAREHDLLLSVRGGGHNVAGKAVNDDGLMIDLSGMTGVHVDPAARIAHVQGGATWADVDRETQLYGLATPGGLVSTTGVAGFTLHGGMSHLRSKHGLALDNLRSVQIVTADGQLRTASTTENPDLFWAVRGAGPNFGVITSFEFQLHPVGPEVMLCATIYHRDDAPQVLRKWRDFVAAAPDDFSSLALFWTVPEGFPDELVGTPIVVVAGVYAGPVDEGERFVQPLRELATPVLDLSQPEPYLMVQSAFDPFFPAGKLNYWKSTFVDQLSDELIDKLSQVAAERPSTQSTQAIWPHNGAVRRVGADEMAYGERRPFMLTFESIWIDPADTDANIAWSRESHASMKRFNAAGTYLNFIGVGDEQVDLLKAAYGDDNYERLVDLKTQYDPANLFRMNQNIPTRT